MKKILGTLLITVIISTLLPYSEHFTVSADNSYSMACAADEFEVSYINDDGSFSKVSCHDNFNDAKKAMKKNENYVVRQENSYSATKILAMNSGLAYTYPNRRGSSTMDLYQDPNQSGNSKYKSTFVSKGYEMFYYDTTSANKDGKGYIRIELNGFEGYADLEYTDLVPFKYINNDIPIYLGGYKGGYVSYGSENPYLVRIEQNYYIISKNGNYKDLVFCNHYAYGVNGNKLVTYNTAVDNAANYLKAGMKENVKYYSNDGINFYSDQKCTQKVTTCYNYYQFLPLRSKTNISASVLDSYVSDRSGSVLKNEGSSFIEAQSKYGFNALMIYAMACHESAYGTSGYARNRNNLFGWNAYDDNPDDAATFSSVESCVKTQMGRYLNWFADYTNWRYFGCFLGNKGAGFNVKYASDPYWAQGIAAIAYNIDKYANGKNGSLSDYNSVQMAYVSSNYNDVLYDSNISWDAKFYKKSTGNDVLFTGRYGTHYQKDMIVGIIGEENGRYKVQCPNPVEDGQLVTEDGKLKYDWGDSVAYIDKKDVRLLNAEEEQTVTPEPPVVDPQLSHDPITIVDDLKLNDGVLSINGIGIISKVNMTDNSAVVHKVEIYNLADGNKVTEFACSNYDTSWYSINDGYKYTYGGFNGSYDLKNLPEGTYYFRLKTSYAGAIEKVDTLKTSMKSLALLSNVISDKAYRLSTNDVYGYRIETDIVNNALDYTGIKKASIRSSLGTVDEVNYVEEDGKNYAVFDGVGMIYYLNYNNDQISHDLYLVNGGNVVKADTTTHACKIDFRSFYNSDYNMDNICYTAKVGLDDLNGDYRLMLEVKNGEYRDLIELNNRYNTKYTLLEKEGLKTEFRIEAVRYRMIMNISH